MGQDALAFSRTTSSGPAKYCDVSGMLLCVKAGAKSIAFSFTSPFLRTVFGNSYVISCSLLILP